MNYAYRARNVLQRAPPTPCKWPGATLSNIGFRALPWIGRNHSTMRRQCTLVSLLAVLCCPAQTPIDSLRAVWQDAGRPDSVRLQAMEQGVRSYMGRTPDSVMAIAGRMEAFARARKDLRWEGWAVNAQGMSLDGRKEYVKALDDYQRAYELRSEAKDQRGMAASLMNMANILRMQGAGAKAAACYERAVQLAKASGNTQQLGHIYIALSNFHMAVDDHARARTYLHKALEIPQQAYVVGEFYVSLGRNAQHLGEYPEALAYLRTALDTMRTLGMEQLSDLAELHMGRVFIAQQELDSATVHLRRAYALSKADNDPAGAANATFFLAYIQRERNDPKGAARIGEKVIPELGEGEDLLLKRNTYELLRWAYGELGDAKNALRYAELFIRTEKEMNQMENQRAADQLEFRQQLTADSLRQAEEKAATLRAHAEAMDAEGSRKRLFMFGGAGILVVAIGLWYLLGRTRKEKARSEEILHNVLPEEIARELREKGTAASREIDQVSILFTDFKGFTALSEQLSKQELMTELDTCFNAFDAIIGAHGVEKIKTIGDSYMCAAGLKGDPVEAARNMVMCGLEMQAFMHTHKAQRDAEGKPTFEMRLGIHTGPVVAGIVGVKKFQYDIWGDTVNTASRMESSGEAGRVNISEATYRLVKDEQGLAFTPRGRVQAKGKGELEMWFVERDAASP